MSNEPIGINREMTKFRPVDRFRVLKPVAEGLGIPRLNFQTLRLLAKGGEDKKLSRAIATNAPEEYLQVIENMVGATGFEPMTSTV